MPAASSAKKKEKIIGTVEHYFDRIGVAIVELKAPLKVGDAVVFRKGETEFTQPVASLQVEHAQVDKAKKGDQVGMKVDAPVKEGTEVLAA
ncbi:MAG: hypothetical protein WCV62_04080 [Candidatus Peribacteraceae bacterium]|jgi:putative protease